MPPSSTEILQGQVQAGENNASHWLQLFNAAYCRKTGLNIYPGSLNLALPERFDWLSTRYAPYILSFPKEEYGGERDILLLPCVLRSLERRKAYLWATTNAAHSRTDPPIVEVITDVRLRDAYHLHDGDRVEVEIPYSDSI